MTIKLKRSEFNAIRESRKHEPDVRELQKIVENSAVPRDALCHFVVQILFNSASRDKAAAKELVYKFIRNIEGVMEGEPIIVVDDEPEPQNVRATQKKTPEVIRRRPRPCASCAGPGPYNSQERRVCAWCDARIPYEQRPNTQLEYSLGPKASG